MKVDWQYHDPLIPFLKLYGIDTVSIEITPEVLKQKDIVILVTDHTDLDHVMIAENAKLVFDTRNAFLKRGIERDNIIKL